MSHDVFKAGYKLLAAISDNVKVKGDKYKTIEFTEINQVQFYKLMNPVYCTREDGEGGKRYIDVRSIEYVYRSHRFRIKYHVCHMNSSGIRTRIHSSFTQ